jgi:hypothetical protein
VRLHGNGRSKLGSVRLGWPWPSAETTEVEHVAEARRKSVAELSQSLSVEKDMGPDDLELEEEAEGIAEQEVMALW